MVVNSSDFYFKPMISTDVRLKWVTCGRRSPSRPTSNPYTIYYINVRYFLSVMWIVPLSLLELNVGSGTMSVTTRFGYDDVTQRRDANYFCRESWKFGRYNIFESDSLSDAFSREESSASYLGRYQQRFRRYSEKSWCGNRKWTFFHVSFCFTRVSIRYSNSADRNPLDMIVSIMIFNKTLLVSIVMLTTGRHPTIRIK